MSAQYIKGTIGSGRLKSDATATLDSKIIVSNTLEREFRSFCTRLTVKNWAKRTRIYIDCSLTGNLRDTKILKSHVARIIERVYELHQINHIPVDGLKADIISVLMSSSEAYRLFTDQTDIIGLPRKRQPSLVESLDASFERLEFIARLPEVFGRGVMGMVVGGSTAYGPFLNVRSYSTSSDVDIIAITSPSFFENNLNKTVFREIGLIESERVLFEERKHNFERLLGDGKVDILSQQFTVGKSRFTVSVHFLPQRTFDSLYATGLMEELQGGVSDKLVAVRDYKERQYEFDSCDRWNFSGERFAYTLPPQEYIDGGVVSVLPGYAIQGERFYPGFYHLIILPASRIIKDDKGKMKQLILSFERVIDKRIKFETSKYKDASLIRSHPRNPIFASGKYDNWPNGVENS